MSRTTPHYRYDPNLGNARDEYTPAAVVHPEVRQPEVPGVFVADVDGETLINTMHGVRSVSWRAAPGTPCIILGYWSDGTIHLKWAAIAEHYRIDGRFPSWVARLDPDAKMAGGGRILSANDPPVARRGPPARLIQFALLVVLALVLLAVPAVHDSLGELLRTAR